MINLRNIQSAVAAEPGRFPGRSRRPWRNACWSAASPKRWHAPRSAPGPGTAYLRTLVDVNALAHLLESWVAQQIITQAGWTDPDLRFWHYRDKDQVEVRLVITRGQQTWGVEVKSSMTALPSDAARTIEVVSCCMRGTVLGSTQVVDHGNILSN
jgi:hypothetical protein